MNLYQFQKNKKMSQTNINIRLTTPEVLDLYSVLNRISDGNSIYWRILGLSMTGNLSSIGTNTLELEDKINKSPNGLDIYWDDLIKISQLIDQTVEIILVGSREPLQIIEKNHDDERKKLDYWIELVDSSYWDIACEEESNLYKSLCKDFNINS
jgi:hypothetical protein